MSASPGSPIARSADPEGRACLLAVETSTATGSIAIVSPEGLVTELTLSVGGSHSDHVMGAIDLLLQRVSLRVEQLAGLAVSVGPGSFTGLRIGMATVKGLAEASALPLVAVPTLEALACNAPAAGLPVCAALDARKREVYAALYEWDENRQEWRPIMEEGAYAPADLAKRLADRGGPVILLGDGACIYAKVFKQVLGDRARLAAGPANQPRAAWVGWLGLRRLASGQQGDPVTLVPRYLRPSEAEIAFSRRASKKK